MERLNKSFGIDVIELNPNPYKSKIHYPSTCRGLDFGLVIE